MSKEKEKEGKAEIDGREGEGEKEKEEEEEKEKRRGKKTTKAISPQSKIILAGNESQVVGERLIKTFHLQPLPLRRYSVSAI
jgi:hypothetical protein